MSSSLATPLGLGVRQARGVPCYLRYPSDPTIVANRCAIAAHRVDTSENDSHRYVGCSDAGPLATSNALPFERRLDGFDLEGDRSRAGRLRPPHREPQRSNRIGHTEGETFACWAPWRLMIQRAWQVLPDFGALISRLIRMLANQMLANQMLAQTWMPHSS